MLKGLTNTRVSLASINARQYPLLKLRFYSYDNVRRSAAQLKAWRILYKGIPELAVNPSQTYQFKGDTLQRGEKLSMSVAVENASDVDADSVAVKWTVRDKNNVEYTTQNTLAPLSKDGVLTPSFSFDTRNMSGGAAQISLEVNPNEAQLEQYLPNNFIQKPFFIQSDQRKPLLDVTFDGLRIMNNDIVSPKPNVVVDLRDENKFFLLKDTTAFKLYLQLPNGTKRQLFFNDPSVKFNPATTATNNRATVEYRPTFTEDGTYHLSVKAQDAEGNAASTTEYSVAFQVITKSSFSNVLNYPNPFSTKTQFVYTLTGEEPPTVFKIQIMSVAGRVVREITQDEIGPLRVGTHRTDYTWDGTDEYGNQLANGVYLYRIIAKKKDGKAFDAYDNGTSEMFKNGIGKLVIIR